MKMKKNTNYVLVFMALLTFLFCACDDSSSAPEEPVDTFDAAVVCPAEGMNAYGEPNRGTFTDTRDGQVYKYTTIGNQVWMAENLKFDAPYSVCYDKIEGFCDTFGRFYSLHQKGELFDLFDQELLDTICPAGWHVPSAPEWNELADSMGGPQNAGLRLRSSENFGEYYKKGTDDCGFSALPAGYWMSNGSLSGEYIMTIYWTSTKRTASISYSYLITSTNTYADINQPKLPIRCKKD